MLSIPLDYPLYNAMINPQSQPTKRMSCQHNRSWSSGQLSLLLGIYRGDSSNDLDRLVLHVESLLKLGLIVPGRCLRNRDFKCTQAGYSFVHKLCSTPFFEKSDYQLGCLEQKIEADQCCTTWLANTNNALVMENTKLKKHLADISYDLAALLTKAAQ